MNHFTQHACVLMALGYRVVPIHPGRKSPALTGWETSNLTPDDISRWSRDDNGIGIICGVGDHPIVGIDIDVSHPEINAAIVRWCRESIGQGVERIGAAPRILIAYRASVAGWTKGASVTFYDDDDPLKPSGKPNNQGVEILGFGQQFVAYHTHPDTGQPYRCVDPWGGFIETPADQLPVVTEAQIEELLLFVAGLVKRSGLDIVKTNGATISAAQAGEDLFSLSPRCGLSVDEARAYLAALPKEMVEDHDQWFRVGMATWHEFNGSDVGLGLWLDWSRGTTKNNFNERDARYRWTTFAPRDGKQPITFRWVIKLATESSRIDQASCLQAIDRLIDAETAPADVVKQVVELVSQSLSSPAEVEIVLYALKTATKVGMGAIRRELQITRDGQRDRSEAAPSTHHGYAKSAGDAIRQQSGAYPVGADGSLHAVGPNNTWVPSTPVASSVRIADRFDGQENCNRRSDYVAIAQHMYALFEQPKFFSDSPVGLCCLQSFYRVKSDGQIEAGPLTAEHRQRYTLPFQPSAAPMPMFLGLLDDTFGPATNGAALAQRDLMQEIFGAIATGVMATFHKAVLFLGPPRSGKSTLMSLLRRLVPPEACVSVSPFDWSNEYYLSSLAGKRLNVVGEMPEDKPLPAAQFKTVTGQDQLMARSVFEMPYAFINEAGHVFASNSFPTTKVHGDEFFVRWLVVGFERSRLGLGPGAITTNLADAIADAEMAAILWWALEGAARLMKRGHFLTTETHQRLMAAWQRRTSSLMEFLNDEDACTLQMGASATDWAFIAQESLKRSVLFDCYVAWCRHSGRRPFSRQRFNEELELPAVQALGVRVARHATLREIVHGVAVARRGWQ